MDSLQQNNYQQCSPYKANQMVFNNQTIHCTNGLNLHFGTFRISMYSVLNNTYLNVERFNKTPDPNAYRTIKNLIEKVGVKVNDQHLEELEALIKHPSSNEISPSHIVDCDLSQMSSIYPNLEKKICKELGITCKYKNKVPDKLFFRIHQQTCEEKYDLAKQTGIDYEHFAWLYHRFAPIINELIEYAYELFNDEKNAKVVWKQVEIKAIQQMVCW